MATLDDVRRIAKRTQTLQIAAIGPMPQLNPEAFSRFPEMAKAVKQFNAELQQHDSRIKNVLAEALLGVETSQ